MRTRAAAAASHRSDKARRACARATRGCCMATTVIFVQINEVIYFLYQLEKFLEKFLAKKYDDEYRNT
jgi:hypothetical protein